MTKRIHLLAAAVAVLPLTACISGGSEPEPTVPDYATTTTAPEEAEEVAARAGDWECGEIKEDLYQTVAIMSRFAEDLESPPAVPDGDALWTPEELREAMRTSARGFTADDQAALNASCELLGQHSSALELWDQGERGDACDVWRPAHQAASSTNFEIGELHPMTANMWISATGSIFEGNGRCIAERAN